MQRGLKYLMLYFSHTLASATSQCKEDWNQMAVLVLIAHTMFVSMQRGLKSTNWCALVDPTPLGSQCKEDWNRSFAFRQLKKLLVSMQRGLKSEFLRCVLFDSNVGLNAKRIEIEPPCRTSSAWAWRPSQCKEDWNLGKSKRKCGTMLKVSMQRGLKSCASSSSFSVISFCLNAKRIEIAHKGSTQIPNGFCLNAKRIEICDFSRLLFRFLYCLNAKRIEICWGNSVLVQYWS